jgi:hypothetical protein
VTVDDDQRRFERYCDGLSDVQLQVLHRVVSRRCVPIYRKVYPGHWEMGMAAAKGKIAAARRG